jgi:2-methylcitrate dehydratase PrpD
MLARKCVQAAKNYTVTTGAAEKVKIALLDVLSAAYEARDLSHGAQAVRIAQRAPGGAAVIGAPFRAAAPEAAFANATLAHGLVREDMHTGSVSHLGIVVFPALLALAEETTAPGADFIRAAVCGYEAGAVIGRALMDAENVRIHRPTGITGTIGAALAGAMLLDLSEDAAVSAVGLAANATVGLNEWPFTGADDMFFHAGFAARNAVTCVELAAMGARGSESALDGRAGLFTALRRADLAAGVQMFSGARPEILSVFHKPAPACNYAQTPCQAALILSREHHLRAADIVGIRVLASAAALNYPGCNHPGPFTSILQAKMSIQYGVAATLARGSLEETNFRLLEDPEIGRLARLVKLEEGAEFTAAYPALQGAEVIAETRDGRTLNSRLNDLLPADENLIRSRFRAACGQRARQIEALIGQLESLADMHDVTRLLG